MQKGGSQDVPCFWPGAGRSEGQPRTESSQPRSSVSSVIELLNILISGQEIGLSDDYGGNKRKGKIIIINKEK